jgi:hypothetical protein
MAVGATKAVARPKRGAAEGSTVPKSRLIKEEKKNAAISGGELRNSSVEPAFPFSNL